MASRSVRLWSAGYWLFATAYLIGLLLPWSRAIGVEDPVGQLKDIARFAQVMSSAGGVELLLLLACLSIARMAGSDGRSALSAWRLRVTAALIATTAFELIVPRNGLNTIRPIHSLGAVVALSSAALMGVAAAAIAQGGLGAVLDRTVPSALRLDQLTLDEKGKGSRDDA